VYKEKKTTVMLMAGVQRKMYPLRSKFSKRKEGKKTQELQDEHLTCTEIRVVGLEGRGRESGHPARKRGFKGGGGGY